MSSVRLAVTGAAGFIGMHTVKAALDSGMSVAWAADCLEPSYGTDLSRLRAKELGRLTPIDQCDLNEVPVEALVENIAKADVVLHLAAWPGVRQGEIQPLQYLDRNIVAFQRILEAAALAGVSTVLFASSSSVYGDQGASGPCREEAVRPQDIKSFYAMTKWMNELQAQDFSRRTGIPTVALRFFTVYGPWGRPDMAYWKFAASLFGADEFHLYGSDGGTRNFSFVGDVAEIIVRLVRLSVDAGWSGSRAINVASGRPTATVDFLQAISNAFGMPMPQSRTAPRPAVDAAGTWADLTKLSSLVGSLPETPIASGAKTFADWFRDLPALGG